MVEGGGRHQKILVIDDDEVVRLTITRALKGRGWSEIAEAGDGQEGVLLFSRIEPDLVITDILMPVKEGLETILEIKAFDPRAKIIAMCGGGSRHDLKFLNMAQQIGADRCLVKPIRPDDLFKAVSRVLGGGV